MVAPLYRCDFRERLQWLMAVCTFAVDLSWNILQLTKLLFAGAFTLFFTHILSKYFVALYWYLIIFWLSYNIYCKLFRWIKKFQKHFFYNLFLYEMQCGKKIKDIQMIEARCLPYIEPSWGKIIFCERSIINIYLITKYLVKRREITLHFGGWLHIEFSVLFSNLVI